MGLLFAAALWAPPGPTGTASALMPHAPISITSNANFNAAHGVRGGTGSATNPYVISGWDIDASTADGIHVESTTAFFVIRNVSVHSVGSVHDGISLVSLRNGKVQNATTTNTNYGISVTYGLNVTVTDSNTTRTYGGGIGVWYSNYVLIQGNGLFANNGSGNANGVGVITSENVTIAANTITYSFQAGVNMVTSKNVTIRDNRLAFNVNQGGVTLRRSTNNRIYHNTFDRNGFVQAYDDFGPENAWDNGYPSGGNSWSDYVGVDHCSDPFQSTCPQSDSIGDSPYSIDSNSTDRYPLVPPNTPPTAAFSVTPTSGYVNTSFQVDASASTDHEDSSSWIQVRWDWTDDGTWDTAWSTTKATTHRYASPGTFTIHLEVMDGGGLTNNATKSVTAVSAPPIVLTATANRTSGYTPLGITFSSSVSGGVPPYTYAWTFGDGAASTLPNPSHTYSTPGTFSASLIVQDSVGSQSADTIMITAIAPLFATGILGATMGLAPATIPFVAIASGGTPPYTYAWTFGDGATSTAASGNHTYRGAGLFTATLTVSDAAGRSRTISLQVRVTAITASQSASSTAVPWYLYAVGLAALADVPAFLLWRRRGRGNRRTAVWAIGIALALVGAVVATIPVSSSSHFSQSSFGASTGDWFLSDPITLPAGLVLDLSWRSSWNLTLGLLPQGGADAFRGGTTSTLAALSYGSGNVSAFSATIPAAGTYVLAAHLSPALGTWTLDMTVTATLPFAYAILGGLLLVGGVALMAIGLVLKPKPRKTPEGGPQP